MSNIITVYFSGETFAKTDPLWQIDYGMKLLFADIDLPSAYEVVFEADGQACTMLGDETGVDIPTAFIQTGETIYARVFLHSGESDGFVEYVAVIPNNAAIAPSDEPPTPEQESVISRLITLIEAAQEQTASDAHDADLSAQAAKASEDNAKTSEDNAKTSETNANNSANAASGSATSANNAKLAAQTAQEKAEEAQGKAEDAQEAAEDARDEAQTILNRTIYIGDDGLFYINN